MATKTRTVPATSKDVRNWFAQNPSKVPTGAEKSVQVSCKGRIKPTAIALYNKENSDGKRYVEGSPLTMPLSYKAGNHRMVTVHVSREQVRTMAGKSGTRGPLSKSDLHFAAEVFAASK